MTVDAKAAVAALLSAKDIEALKVAVDAAAFLDGVPGDDRQKLRGERGAIPGEAPEGRSRQLAPPWAAPLNRPSAPCPRSRPNQAEEDGRGSGGQGRHRCLLQDARGAVATREGGERSGRLGRCARRPTAALGAPGGPFP